MFFFLFFGMREFGPEIYFMYLVDCIYLPLGLYRVPFPHSLLRTSQKLVQAPPPLN